MGKEISEEIERNARKYMDKPYDELFDLFLQEWSKVQPIGKLPVRGNTKDFWQGVKSKLVARILKNRDTITTTTGFLIGVVTTEVVKWAQSVGVDLSLARLPIAMLVALVTQSVMDHLESEK